MNRKIKIWLVAIGLLIILGAGAVSAYFFIGHKAFVKTNTESEKDIYANFVSEIYDTIKENYWEKLADDQLANIYKLGAEKISGDPQTLETADKEGILKMTSQIIKDMDPEKKKEFVTSLSNIVLVNLKPFGRSQLMTSKQQETLVNTVNNKDPNADLYTTLGVSKGASEEEIKNAYDKKLKEAEPQKNTDEGKKLLANIDRAFDTLSRSDSKESYDQKGVETTVDYRVIAPDIFYLKIKRISPQTFEEFQKAANSTENKKLSSLILDLRGNIGGAIDTLSYFLGPFIGPNSYAYDFFHQGNYEPFKTKVGWLPSLVKFKKVVVLIDGESQSSAEVMAAAIKKYNVGVLVGTKTKGWGTIEQIMPLKTQLDSTEKYSLLMVHSLTVRDDGQPIEGRGVDPVVNIEDKDWDKQLLEYFNYPPLIKAVGTVLKEK